MSDEVELTTLWSLGGLFKRQGKHPRDVPAGMVCDNCGEVLHGEYCHQCGQEFGEPRRSINNFSSDVFESLFHADGRLWRTLPRLWFRPGRLTADYIAGRRAPQAPPFSVFLVVVVMFVFLGALSDEHAAKRVDRASTPAAAELAAIAPKADDTAITAWFKARGRAALQQPERFAVATETWEHRLAIAMLPISALLLSVLFMFQRQFLIYDHLVFSMHSLAVFGMVLMLWMAAAVVVGGWANWLFLLLPAHLFVHMRGAYETSVAGTLVRMGLLALGSAVSYSILLFALVLISLSAMGS
jgi:hypothetical protein